MLSVRCENCQREFGTPVHTVGKIEYTRCKNVFRVAYRYRTPCPHCHRILQLSPHGKNQAIGVVLHLPVDEVTEQLTLAPGTEVFDIPTDRVAIGPDATLPRESVVANGSVPLVRVSKAVKAPQKKEAFRILDQSLAFPKALHVALKAQRKKPLPWLKIVLGFVIFLGTSMTIGLTILALHSGKKEVAPVNAVKKPELTEKATIIPEIPPLPQGGPENDSDVVDEPDVKQKPKRVSMRSQQEEKDPLSDLHLPRIDRLTSTYGERRDPFKGKESFHGGIDIAGEKRSEIKAALNGKVKFVGYRGGYGNVVVLSHGDGYETLYGHLEKPLVREGEKVNRGDLLGLLGSTGRSTGPHVHFELHKDGKKIDPLRAELMARKAG